MKEAEIKEIVSRQRNYFFSGATLNVEHRIRSLKNCGPVS